MQSIAYLKASDGSGNASVATVQNVRSALATTIQVDTVQGIPTEFYGTMGTPHTFVDPVTSEEITVISEATAVDFAGHVDGSDLEIDEIAPGYTDNGSAVGDIVIIRPITEYANNLHNILEEAHNDDGSLKNTSLDAFRKPSEVAFSPFVASGGVIAQTSGLTASFSDLVYYITGLRHTKTGVANRLYTASKDTYVDIGTDGVLDYTEVANGAASPALSASHIRLAKVVTSGAAVTSVVATDFDTNGVPIRPLRSIRKVDLEKAHFCSLYFSTGGDAGGQVIGASEVIAAWDTIDAASVGIVPTTGAGASMKITRDGIYSLSATIACTDGTPGTLLLWFDISLDGGSTYLRMRIATPTLEVDTQHSTIYQLTTFLPANAILRTTLYNGSGSLRVATPPAYNSANGRRYLGPKFTVAEIR